MSTQPVGPGDPATSGPTGDLPRTMRAVIQDSYGDADTWHIADVALPGIAGDEVLLKVHAAGMDRGTWHLMTGMPYFGRIAFGLRKPRQPVPGLDVAGVVVATGAQVT